MCVEIEIKVLIYFWCAVINFPDGTSATTYWTQIDGWVISHVVRAANNVFRLYCPTKTSRIHLIVTFGNVNIEADHLFIVSICVLRCNDSSFHIVEDILLGLPLITAQCVQRTLNKKRNRREQSIYICIYMHIWLAAFFCSLPCSLRALFVLLHFKDIRITGTSSRRRFLLALLFRLCFTQLCLYWVRHECVTVFDFLTVCDEILLLIHIMFAIHSCP